MVWQYVFVIPAETITFYPCFKQGQERNAHLDWKGFSWTTLSVASFVQGGPHYFSYQRDVATLCGILFMSTREKLL